MSLKKLDNVDHKWGLPDWQSKMVGLGFSRDVKHDIKALVPVAQSMAKYIHEHKFPCVLVGGTIQKTSTSSAYSNSFARLTSEQKYLSSTSSS